MKFANYEYYEQIGQGAFGTIYKGRNIRTGETVVIKTEPIDVKFLTLKHESNILNILYSKSCRNIPPTYWYGTIANPNRRALVMPFYKESLDAFIPKTEQSVLNIMCSAISILNHIHDKYVVHRDIKPANFMIHNDELVLIDFGLASFYVDSEEQHRPPANPKKQHIIGTPKYASFHVHEGEEYSRRDDIMSMVYVGLFLLYGSKLWSDIPAFETQLKNTDVFHPINQWFKSHKPLQNIMELTKDWYQLRITDAPRLLRSAKHPRSKELEDSLSEAKEKTHRVFVGRIQFFAEQVYKLSFQERPSYKEYIELFAKTI